MRKESEMGMSERKVPVQSLIDHIKTAVDVDPWAKKMAAELLTDPQRRCVVYCEGCAQWDAESGLSARMCAKWKTYTKRYDFCSYGQPKGV